MSLKLIHAIEQGGIFPELEKFLLPHEKFCSTLYEKVLTQDESVYAVVDEDVQGVFSFSKGHSFVCCIPKWSKEMKKVVSDFMKDKKVFCIHGEESEVLKMERLLKNKYEEKDCRNMFLMEYGGQICIDEDAPKAFVCQMEDCDRLMPLQTGFCVEEVLPPWKEVNLPLERMNLDKAVKNNTVYALGDEDCIYTKANINMFSNKVIQISGVYTQNDFRGKGYATALVNRIALIAEKVGRTATLLVRQENMAAYNAYRKAGFGISGTYRIVYFK